MRVWVSGVRNPTHLVYVASWLRSQPGSAVGVIDAGGFIARGLVQHDDVRRWLGGVPGVEVTLTDAPTGETPRAYVAVGVAGIKPWLALRRANPLARLPVIVVDEGLGSYGTVRSQFAAQVRQGGRPARQAAKVAARSAARVLTSTRWSLYRHTDDRWAVNAAVADEFRRVQPAPSGRVVYLSQPWPALGVTSRERYLGHLHQVQDAVASQGRELIIKPHPAENPRDFTDAGLAVHETRTPAELDPEVIGAHAVLGTQSTALLNLASVHGRPALRVHFGDLDGLEAALSRRQASLLRAFLPPPVGVGDLSLG